MTRVITHTKVTTGTVDNDVEVDLSDWNDTHTQSGTWDPADGGTGTSTPFTQGAVVFAGASGIYSQATEFSWDDSLKKLNLNLSGGALAAAETSTGFQMDGADGFATTIFMDSHGATAAIDFRQQGGTKAAPTATAAGATMGQINFQGWDGTAYGKNARLRAVAEASGANWTLTDHGVGLAIFTTAPGTTSLTEKFHVYGNGGATIGSALTNNGAGTLNLAALYSNNVLIVDSSGNVTGAGITASGNLSLGAANTFAFTGRTAMQSGSDGNLTLLNNAGTGFTSLKFGGATASFPEIKRNATAINFRLADDSADAPITAAAATFSGLTAPAANDGAALGSTALQWSDLFLASGGVLNFNNGNYTVTHSAGLLTFSGAVTHTGATTFSAALTYGGVTLSNAVTGTGNMVLSATPTFTGSPVLAAPSASTLIVGSSTTLVSPAITAITANSTTLPAPAAGTILHVAGANSSTAGIVLDAFNSSPNFTFRTALTSAGSPSAVTSGSVMMTFGGIGYGATGYSSSARMQITGKATENWSDTAQGTSLQFNTTPNTTVTPALALLIQNSGGVSIGTSTDPGIGALLTNTSIKSQGATAGIGYATGAGGAVSQATNRTTGVTLNTVAGAITLFSQVNTAVSQATAQSFTVTNSAVAATDVPHVVQKSGTDKYEIFVTNVAAGSFQITNYAVAGTTNEAPVFNFVIIKGVAA